MSSAPFTATSSPARQAQHLHASTAGHWPQSVPHCTPQHGTHGVAIARVTFRRERLLQRCSPGVFKPWAFSS
eukprot:1294115-Rhodomonas_salina.1